MVSITASMPRPSGPAVKAAKVPPPHRPSLSTKRTSSMAAMDEDTPVTPNTAAKRAKVQFSREVEVRTTDEFDKPLDIVREEVSRALARHKTGNSDEYLQIKAAFGDELKPPPASELPFRRRLLAALTGNAVALNRACGDLVTAVLESDWATQDIEYLETFRRFLLVLISANSSWIRESLEVLVSSFSRSLSGHAALSGVSRQEAHKRVHLVIESVLQKFPHNGPTSLRNIIDASYPAPEDSIRAHVLYVHNIFRITDYAPELEAAIMSTVTGRLVNLDMQIQTDIEEFDDLDDLLVEHTPGALDTFINSLEDDDDDDLSDDGSDIGEAGLQSAEEKAKAVRREIQKMDVLMDLAFEQYAKIAAGGPEAQERAFSLLESQFDAYLLPSFRSRHTQFLLFHFAQISPELMDRFAGTCLIRAMDKGKNSHVRQSAAAYLASFVARGNHVSAQIVRDVFAFISEELADLRKSYEPNCRGPDLHRYGTYYALVQALLYIFCFRWRDLESTPSDPGSPMSGYNCLPVEDGNLRHTFMAGVKDTLDQNILSPLNPLKICSPIIVEEFAKVSHHVGILFIFPKIELNKRLRLVPTSVSALERENALSGRRDESLLQLDEYFPFDPYLLPRSKRWLQGDYREFQGLPGDEEDEDSESDNLESDEDADDDSESDDE